MKMFSLIRIWLAVLLAIIVSGCERDISAVFEVTEVRALSRDEVETVMGHDWARRRSGVSMPPTVIFVELASNADLAEFIRKRHAGLSVAAFICDTKQRLGIAAPMIYSGGKNVTARSLDNERADMVNGVYRYQIVLWTNDPEDQISELLEGEGRIYLRAIEGCEYGDNLLI